MNGKGSNGEFPPLTIYIVSAPFILRAHLHIVDLAMCLFELQIAYSISSGEIAAKLQD